MLLSDWSILNTLCRLCNIKQISNYRWIVLNVSELINFYKFTANFTPEIAELKQTNLIDQLLPCIKFRRDFVTFAISRSDAKFLLGAEKTENVVKFLSNTALKQAHIRLIWPTYNGSNNLSKNHQFFWPTVYMPACTAGSRTLKITKIKKNQ